MKYLLILLSLLLASPVLAWPARIIQVTDGDTLTVELVTGGERVKVRLHGIDAPERNQPGGEAARAFPTDPARQDGKIPPRDAA